MNGKVHRRGNPTIYGDTQIEPVNAGDTIYVVEVKGEEEWQHVQRSVFAASERRAIEQATDEVLETLGWHADVLEARILTREGAPLYVTAE